jgi:hypothetical protein
MEPRPMKHTGIAIPGYALDKNGKPVRSQRGLSVSKRIARAKSKKARVVPRPPFGARLD